jgi:hypothetical protein
MIAVLCPPGLDARVVETDGSLRALQAAVGGYIGELRLAPGIMAYIHDEGVLVGLPWNRRVGPNTYVAGPIIVVGIDDAGECRSLAADEQRDVLRLLNVIAPRLETKPATFEQLEAWLGEKAVRFYSGEIGAMEEVCTDCGAKLAPERKGFCPVCHASRAAQVRP